MTKDRALMTLITLRAIDLSYRDPVTNAP